ncbi:hypothetical protein [Clostridium luticellarii]|uniref:Zinc-finger domain-containing protein n=1 Tax=Clostridium luticellarii TaxID=1691940 RepID=A0A2T0BLQ5_9CLOT|nr:hypothetical protein [Clostridium luticellarii]MCI1967914.1 hypothetical protein [Clostridium luticellarii]MCI1996645.1 hypothetical protein [Clostridium luticellarii]MCI2040823.1 hypothetical protein [Clostridium luticellarii]PRR84830.1 hypothetical protein CLLU_21720 [Clostridium luticellarii]
MSDDLFNSSGHIKNSALKRFRDGNLNDIELVILSKHIESCEECAEKLTDSFEQVDFLKVPGGFQEEIKDKINRRHEKNRQFFFYSLKVSMAACIALVFVFSSTLNFMASTGVRTLKIKSPQFTVVNSINMKLGNFTNKIIDMEGFNNEIQKK